MLAVLLVLVPHASAHSSGMVGVSTRGCTGCHGTAADADVTGDLAGPTEAAPGDLVTLTFTLSSANGRHQVGGLDVSASGGSLFAGAGTRSSAGEITHTAEQAFSGGVATWSFGWTAPSAEGTYTLYSSGLAANDNGAETGDGWDLDTLTIVVDDGCDDLDGDGSEACDDGSGDDCDDADATVSPAGVETCDGVDQDCDGVVDDDPSDGAAYWPDTDGDGYGDDATASTRSCDPLAGFATVAGDCDDTRAHVNPGGVERCDGMDEDCDGIVDDGATDSATWFRDADGDGYGDAMVHVTACAAPLDHVEDATDCDDTRAGTNPGAAEACDALDLDEDCDGLADDADPDVTGTSTFHVDADGDGYGGATSLAACAAPSGATSLAGDCDDTDPAWNPAAAEACDDPTDYNCDGSTGYADADGDGVAACQDCDDRDAGALPGATETCDGVDDDCDGHVDEADAADARAWFVDADADGWGSAGGVTLGCTQPAGYDDDALDCDDTAPGTRPDAPEEWYDGVDQDCDGADDDRDGDGLPLAYDCDDLDPAVHVGAADAPYDGVDADCGGGSDYDADHDGVDSASYGGLDCDDADPTVFPGAQDEPYDDVIKDCDASDEHDADGDGFDLGEDCDDARSDVFPGAAEAWYDGVDQDCDGNDADQDGDGVLVSADCDDTDPRVLVACDTGDPADTAPDVDDGDPDPPAAGGRGCGCDAAPGTASLGAAFGLLAFVARRRRSPG